MGASVCAQTTWTFKNNTAVWGATGVTLKGGNQYDANANAVTSGGVTFTGESGFVSTALGIGFNAVGSYTDENISFVVPAGYKATVTIYTSSNRTVKAKLGNSDEVTYNASWAASTKEFSNADGTEDLTFIMYCNQNAGGSNQKQAPFVQEIVLTDMTTVKSYPWTANAVATINGVKTTLKTYNSAADVDEGSQYTIVVDKVIKYDDAYYALNDDAFSANVYGKTYTMGNAAAAFEYNYEIVDKAVFYGEVEDIYKEGSNSNKATGSTVLSNGGGYSAMSSKGGYVTLSFSVPETAVYALSLGMNNTNGTNRGFNYSIDGADVSETITVSANTPHVETISDQILSAGEHTITMNITYSLTPVFDYLLITKTGEAVSVPVGTAGFATYANHEKALDFTNVSGLTAFTATVSGDVVTFTPATKVPAGTGLLLKGATADVPVIASAEAISDNILYAPTTDVTGLNYDADGYYNYILTQPADKEVGFYRANNNSVAVGKAYLRIDQSAGARQFTFIGLNGETTGIEAINTVEQKNGEVYNLQGQRVAKTQKGLFIVNGKKVIMK